MTPFMLYIWQILDSIIRTLGILSLLSLGAILISLAMWLIEGSLKTCRTTVILMCTFIILITTLTLTPTTEQAAIIFGVPTLLEQAQNMNADKIPAKLVDYLNVYLDSETKKLKETTK